MIQIAPSIRYGVTHRADTSQQDRAAQNPFHHPCFRGAKQLEAGTLEEEVALAPYLGFPGSASHMGCARQVDRDFNLYGSTLPESDGVVCNSVLGRATDFRPRGTFVLGM